jgi:hypothetical protein
MSTHEHPVLGVEWEQDRGWCLLTSVHPNFPSREATPTHCPLRTWKILGAVSLLALDGLLAPLGRAEAGGVKKLT